MKLSQLQLAHFGQAVGPTPRPLPDETAQALAALVERRLKSSNYYAVQRRNYAELPEEYRRKVNSEAMQDFPSLENTHPTLSDRVIAARLQDPSKVARLEQGCKTRARLPHLKRRNRRLS